MLAVSIAETFFVFVIGCITTISAYFTWTSIVPRLPVKIPPVLLCILIGCCMRLVCKPLLETQSADSAFDRWNDNGPANGDGDQQEVFFSPSSQNSEVSSESISSSSSPKTVPPLDKDKEEVATDDGNSNNGDDQEVTITSSTQNQTTREKQQQQQKSINKKKKNTKKPKASSAPTTTINAEQALRQDPNINRNSNKDGVSSAKSGGGVNINRKLHMYGEGVVRTLSSPVVSLCLGCVGLLIGSHIDVKFLKQHTFALLSLTGGASLGAYIATTIVGLILWPMHLFPMIHLVASTAMERSSSAALATISDSSILSAASSSMPQQQQAASSSSTSTSVYFARSTIFAAAAMDVLAVLMFVLSLGVIQRGTSVAHLTILEIVLGTLSVAVLTLVLLKFHLTIEHKIVQPIVRKWNLSDRVFSVLKQSDRAVILVLSTLVVADVMLPGSELLLAAVGCGMKIKYDEQQFLASQQTQEENSRHHAAEDDSLNLVSTHNNNGVLDDVEDHHGHPSSVSLINTIENHSIIIYSVLFSVIGLRLDASQLIETLVESPKTALLLFGGRLLGLTFGGIAGSVASGTRTFMKYRGLSLVTRIAVSIILLQKMEDALVGAKPIVHAAIGGVLIDMCLGPALLQWTLKKVVAEEKERMMARGGIQPQPQKQGHVRGNSGVPSTTSNRHRHYLDVAEV